MTNKELSPQEKYYVTRFYHSLKNGRAAKRCMQLSGDKSFVNLDGDRNHLIEGDSQTVKMLEGGARGMYNEAVHPLVDNTRTTDEFVKGVIDSLTSEIKQIEFQKREI